MAVNGNHLIISLGGVAIAGAKSAEIQSSCEVIEMASASQNTWKKFIAGRKEWSVSVGYIVAAVNQVGTDLLRIGTTYALTIVDRDGNTIASGNAICTNDKVDAARGSLIHGSFVFKGTDALAST